MRTVGRWGPGEGQEVEASGCGWTLRALGRGRDWQALGGGRRKLPARGCGCTAYDVFDITRRHIKPARVSQLDPFRGVWA